MRTSLVREFQYYCFGLFDHPTNTTKTLWQKAEEVFLKWYKKSAGALRLLGFGASGLQKAGSGQHHLFPEPE